MVAISTLVGAGGVEGDPLDNAEGALDALAEGEMVGTFEGKNDGRDEGAVENVGIVLGSDDCVGTELGLRVGVPDGAELGIDDGAEEWDRLGLDEAS